MISSFYAVQSMRRLSGLAIKNFSQQSIHEISWTRGIQTSGRTQLGIWTSEGFFSKVADSGLFNVVAKSTFSGWGNSGEIIFYQLESKRKTFYAKN